MTLLIPPEQGRTDGKLGGAEPDQHVFVLTLPAELVSKLTKTKRLAVLHPERRQRGFQFNGGRSERPGSSRVGATGK